MKSINTTTLPLQPPSPPQQIPTVANPIEACAWCWPSLHPGQPYPEHWSSTICAGHLTWFDAQRSARRSRRLGEQRASCSVPR